MEGYQPPGLDKSFFSACSVSTPCLHAGNANYLEQDSLIFQSL